ncbi:ATP-binding protein [Tolypothrix sp. PCC 7910]|uniref:sensor histidine kinase n=1 Tax=Tolypothrix sp. PCC 7910 TaxID=2099387 RepID=UPI000E332F1C|nr:ATP-binding protein [Tolypothrix sp. PCC 7910]AXN94188.1 bacterial type cyanobacterial phytochrome [Tolypothrix sp. PCC 7910]
MSLTPENSPENTAIAPFEVDLTNCDREPIHIPGSIQPHGMLLALTEPELTIVQVSQNTDEILGIAATELINQPISRLLDAQQIDFLRNCLGQEDLTLVNPIELTIAVGENARAFDGIIHRSDSLLILELEPVLHEKNYTFFNFYHLVKVALSKVQNASTLDELCQIIVKHVRQMNSFDRVMIYRFDENWHGTVIAEDKPEHLSPYLSLRYPASDIPKQARQLYRDNWLRLIPDVDYQPVPLLPNHNPITNQSTDLRHSILRSVSPLHIEYLHNMGVKASMSISLLKNQKLWGLIACHHESPKYVPYEIRSACEFLGQMASLELTAKEDSENAEYKMQSKSVQAKLVEYMAAEENFVDGLLGQEPNLLDLVNATGAAVCINGEYQTLGRTPQHREIEQLIKWLSQHTQEEVFHTNSLSQVMPEATAWKDVASGLIALSISKSQNSYLLWFRPEVLQTVDWAGNPHKPVEVSDDGSFRLSPRKSFDLWKEILQQQSLPWENYEIEAVWNFRSAIVGVVLRKADELAKMNVELQRSNDELDAFAYIASHDLKEPLRGIHHYSSFLIEDYGNTLDEEGKSRLRTLIRLTQRMENLIDSLLHFSRLGRVELDIQPTDLNDLVQRVLDVLSARIQESGAVIRIPRPLPTIMCDRVQVSEIFTNLIANGIKYNDKSEIWVEVGYLDPVSIYQQSTTFYVRDNGIGIRDRHFESIFRIFKRLHGPTQYGGGTGAGLTIAKKVVERHGGNIWVESTYGEGSTFYFTLQEVK